MATKVSKSDKSKSKFAQSNINYVYKGNSAESNHKPTVRQYGMQVVGKLQGTRRLPPPAWVPSIKSESGGLDSRVAIVPSGGSGWGVTTCVDVPSTDTRVVATADITSTTTSVPVLNGSIGRMAIENSFEPTYTRPNLGASSSDTAQADGSVAPTPIKAIPTDSGSMKSLTDMEVRDSPTLDRMTSSVRRTQPTSVGGGLAANKPFFQRPLPVTSSSGTPQTSDGKSELLTKATSGACEVLRSPAGWAAIGDQEPNFDEKISFSDDEDLTENKVFPSQAAESGESTPPVGKSPSGPHITQAPILEAAVSHPSGFTGYGEPVGKNVPDVWSSLDDSPHLNNQSSARHGFQRSFETCGMNFDRPTMLADRCLQHPVAQSFRAPPHVIPDAVFSGDSEADVQNVQRRVRTQEFKSAVERAQQARLVRQKSDSYSLESDVVHRSLAGLLSEFDDAKVSSVHSLNPTLAPSTLPQLLLSSVYQQQTGIQTHPDLATALAAAKAVALACNETTNPASRPGGPVLPRPNMHSSIGANPWHDQLAVSAPPAAAPLSTLYNIRPPLFPSVPNSVPLAPGNQPQLPTGPTSNAVLLNPQHFVERFLQFLNQQQPVNSPQEQPQQFSAQRGHTPVSLPESSRSGVDFTTVPTSVLSKGQSAVAASKSEFDPQSRIMQTVTPVSLPKQDAQHLPQSTGFHTDAQPETSTAQAPDDTSQIHKAPSKRVPGLMEVKVSSTSPHLSAYWDQNDPEFNARHRNKFSNDRGKGFTKNRRQVYRHSTEEPKSNKERSSDMGKSSGDDTRGHRIHESSHTRTWQLKKESSVRTHTDSDQEIAKTNAADDTRAKSGVDHRDSYESLNEAPEENDVHLHDKGQSDRGYPSALNRRAFVSVSKARRGSTSVRDYNSALTDYHWQGAYSRRGRGFYNHAPGSRTFHEDNTTDDRYHYSEHKSQGGDSYRKTHSTSNGRAGDVKEDYRADDSYRHRNRDPHTVTWSQHRGRGVHQSTGHRDFTRFSHNQRPYASSESRRHHGTRVNFSHGSRHAENDLSDGEASDRHTEMHRVEDPVKKETRDDYSSSGVADMADKSGEAPKQPATKVLNQLDDSDIPTVRVPATEMGLGAKSSYPKRVDPSHRSTGSRRGVSRMGPFQQQGGNKRYNTSTVPPSRRYREMRQHYRDDEDDGGGAAAGGAGHSTSTGKSSGQNEPGNRSQTGNRIKPSNNRGGGNQDCNELTCNDACTSSSFARTGCTNHNNSVMENSTDQRLRPNFYTSTDTNKYSRSHVYHTDRAPSTYSQRFRHNVGRRPVDPNRCANLAEIPPLMSIKPTGPFCRNSVDLGADHETAEQSSSEDHGKPQPCDAKSAVDPTDDCPDGFTEVVPKSSRKLVRRAIGEKQSSQSHGSSDSRGTTHKPAVFKTNASKQSTSHQPSKSVESRPKSTSLRPTFMGPPLPATASTSAALHDGTLKSSSSPVDSTSALPSQIATRTWSKVVGTKTLTTTSQCGDTSEVKAVVSTEYHQITKAEQGETSVDATEKASASNIAHNSVSATVHSSDHNWTSVSRDADPIPSSSIAIGTSTASQSLVVVSNNVCKVKPQQQQQAPLLVSSTMSVGQVEPPIPITAEVNPNPERAYETSLDVTPPPKVLKDNSQLADNPVPLGSDMFTGQLPAAYDPTRFGLLQPNSNLDNQFPSTFWQPPDPSLDNVMTRYPSNNVALPFTLASASSDVLNSVLSSFTGPVPSMDKNSQQQPGALVPRNHSYATPSYAPSVPSSMPYGSFSNPVEDASKSLMAGISQSHVDIPSMTGAMFMPTQQPSTGLLPAQSSHPFSGSWTVPQGLPHLQQQQQQVLQSQRYRHRQPEQSAFNNFTYQSKLQNDFGFMPPITGCLQPGPSTGLYSTIQGHSSFHPNTARPTVPSGPAHNPWSILGTSSVTPSLLAPNHEYGNLALGATANNETGLLPHPQNGYAGGHGSIAPSSTTPNIMAHQNFYGMVGNERMPGEQSQITMRQRMYSSRSPNTQNHQPLQVHSTFYPSLSPSHQRLQLQQFAGSHNRPALPGLLNPHNGLFAAASFSAQQVPQSATPPIPPQGMGPIKLFSSPFLPAT